MANTTESTAGTVTLTLNDGLAHIEQGTPLTRLHFFDGKFLSADALTLEQDYHRNLVRMSNLAGGWGVVHGLGIELAGDQLTVTPGLAITPAGSTVQAGQAFTTPVSDLLKVVAPAPASGNTAFGDCTGDAKPVWTERIGTGLYEVTVGPIDGLCGNEAVYGKLCEDACVTDSQRPYWREGLVLRLRPISLTLPDSSAVTLTQTHQRNRVASAYFASEPWLTSSLLSSNGLAGHVWCNPAQLYGRDEVPIGLLVREGGSTRLIDAWSARRERMDSQARGYWQGRLSMRPWNVFIAQILQFQCQLSGTFAPGSTAFEPLDDDCRRLRTLLKDSVRELEATRRKYAKGNQTILEMLGTEAAKQYTDTLEKVGNPYRSLETLGEKLADADKSLMALPQNRLLLNSGFVELPPAGYLPVVPGKQPINTQLERMFGEGVKLHYCTARPDYIPHAVEEAQHLQRISLTRGLDRPQQIEHVEIFVPDGQLIDSAATDDGTYWTAEVSQLLPTVLKYVFRAATREIALSPAARDRIKEMAGDAALAKVEKALAAAEKASVKTEAAAADTPAASEIFNKARIINRGGWEEVDPLAKRSLTGLARTSLLDGGGAAVTLVCRLDEWVTGSREYSPVYRANTLLVNEKIDTTGNNAANTTGGGEVLQPSISRPLAMYFDLSIGQDPFAGKEGDELSVGFEVRFLISVVDNKGVSSQIADTVRGTGQLSLDEFINLGGGKQAIRGTVALNGRLVERVDGTDQAGAFQPDLAVVLSREGSMKAGTFQLVTLLDESAALRWVAEWSGAPRSATLGVVERALANREVARSYALNKLGDYTHLDESAAVTPLVALNEVASVLQPESAVRLAALSTLSWLADVTADDAFLTRARRRLFPDTNVAATLQVRASLDWVMFRRQRKAVCEQSTAVTQIAPTEAFQTWHLKLNSAGLAALQAALDQNDAEALKKYKFQRVDVLHYADAATSPTESLNQILSDWKRAQPGKTVALARVWERTPQTGQGWQNHARIDRLVSLLSGLLTPPSEGAVHAQATAPQPLADVNFDGGLLLVTVDEVVTAKFLHRVVMMTGGMVATLQKQFSSDKVSGWKALQEMLHSDFVKDILLTFEGKVLSAASQTELMAAHKSLFDSLSDPASNAPSLSALRLDAKTLSSGEDPDAQHKLICTKIGVPDADQLGNFALGEADLGGGSHVLTLVGYTDNRIN